MSELTELPDDRNPPPLQFSLRSIMIVQAVVAAFLSALLVAGVFAVVAAFVATLILAGVRVRPERLPGKRMIVDLMGGVVLPCLCLWFDPFVFHNDGMYTVFALLAVVLQIVVLVFWLVAGRWLGRFAAVIAGALWCGVVMAGLIGIVMLPISLIGLLAAGIGSLGCVPFLTVVVFARNAARAARQGRKTLPRGIGTRIILGILLAVVIPAAGYGTLGPALGDLLRTLPQPLSFPLFD